MAGQQLAAGSAVATGSAARMALSMLVVVISSLQWHAANWPGFTSRSSPSVAVWSPMSTYPACAIDEYASSRFTSVWSAAPTDPTSRLSTAMTQTTGRQSVR